MRQIGERRDLAWPSRKYVAIAALGTTPIADRIELQTQVIEQAWVPGRKLQRSLENRDRGSRFVALRERVAQKEQQFRMARLELRRSAVDTRLRGGDVPARERGTCFSKQGVCGNGRGQESSVMCGRNAGARFRRAHRAAIASILRKKIFPLRIPAFLRHPLESALRKQHPAPDHERQ